MSKTAETRAPSASSADGVPQVAVSTSLMSRVQRCLLKRWKAIVLAAVPCAMLAAGLGWAMGKNVYLVEGKLLYQEPSIPAAITSYKPDDFLTLKERLTDTPILEAMARESELGVPPSVLRKSIKTDNPTDTKVIKITMEWEDPQKGSEMLNKLMSVFSADADLRRKQRLDDLKETAATNLRNCKSSQEVIEKQYRVFADKVNATTTNIKDSLLKANADIERVKLALAQTKSGKLANIEGEIEATKRRIVELKDTKNPEGALALKRTLAEIDTKLRQEKVKLASAKEGLTAKQKTLEVSKNLFNNKVITQGDLDKDKEAVAIQEEKVKTAEIEIQSLEKRMEDEKENPTNPDMKAAQLKLEALEGSKEGILKEIKRQEEELLPLQDLARRLVKLQQEAEQTDLERTNLQKRREELEKEDQGLANLRADKSSQFVVVAPADAHLSFNTAKKIAPVAFAIPMFLFVGLLLFRDMRTSDWQTESLVNQLGLPLLGRCTHEDRPEIDPTEARTLALRLRQFVPEDGGTILFGSINEGNEVDELLGHVGRFLAMRDERVLILDTRIAQGEPSSLIRHVERPVEMIAAEGVAVKPAPGVSGLVQYLVFEGHEVREFIHPTGLGSVDFLPAGGPYPLTDVLASEPMKDLLKQLRQEYSVILMAGPPVTNTTDTEILAAYAHGMVVLLNGPVSSEARPLTEFFQSLREANAPLLGAVLC